MLNFCAVSELCKACISCFFLAIIALLSMCMQVGKSAELRKAYFWHQLRTLITHLYMKQTGVEVATVADCGTNARQPVGSLALD